MTIDHDRHLVCCSNQYPAMNPRNIAIVNTVVGGAAFSLGIAMLAATGVATAWSGAGVVLLAIAAIAWAVFTTLQYRQSSKQLENVEELTEKKLSLLDRINPWYTNKDPGLAD